MLEDITILDVFVGCCNRDRKTDRNLDGKSDVAKRVPRDGGNNVALGNVSMDCSDLGKRVVHWVSLRNKAGMRVSDVEKLLLYRSKLVDVAKRYAAEKMLTQRPADIARGKRG